MTAERAPASVTSACTHAMRRPSGDHVGCRTWLRPDSTRVGIAFHVQLVPSVPHGREDQQLDVVVTEVETIDCNRHPDAP